jgi:hypothetical protein
MSTCGAASWRIRNALSGRPFFVLGAMASTSPGVEVKGAARCLHSANFVAIDGKAAVSECCRIAAIRAAWRIGGARRGFAEDDYAMFAGEARNAEAHKGRISHRADAGAVRT